MKRANQVFCPEHELEISIVFMIYYSNVITVFVPSLILCVLLTYGNITHRRAFHFTKTDLARVYVHGSMTAYVELAQTECLSEFLFIYLFFFKFISH